MKAYYRGYAQIHLDHIKYNIESIKGNLPEDTQLMLVVKADAYGHGAQTIAKEFEELAGVWGFGVASLEEAISLRDIGIKKPILVLGVIFPDQYNIAIEADISLNIYDKDMAWELIKVAKDLNKKAKVHIKVDTGMGRLGFASEEESKGIIKDICSQEEIQVEGIFTHFACGDEKDKGFTRKQMKDFLELIDDLEKQGLSFSMKHCSNSAVSIDLDEYAMNMIRIGIAMYGLYPSEYVDRKKVKLKPAMTLHSTIGNIKILTKGMPVSYGSTYIAPSNRKVAIVPMGYADGYPRALSNKAYVLIHGQKAPIIGRICMDQMMVDITDIKEAQCLSPVTLIGRDGEVEIRVEELGQIAEKFNYEFICGVGKRIPRNYLKNGEIIKQADYFS